MVCGRAGTDGDSDVYAGAYFDAQRDADSYGNCRSPHPGRHADNDANEQRARNTDTYADGLPAVEPVMLGNGYAAPDV